MFSCAARAILWFASLSSSFLALAQSPEPTLLDLHQVLKTSYVCPVPHSIQFLTEDELVLLAAPTSKCYDAVGQIEIVAVSIDGNILARRHWTSTESGIVLRPERLVLPQMEGVEVLDKCLKTIQKLRVARHGFISTISATDTGVLSIVAKSRTYNFAGSPLQQIDLETPKLIPEAKEIISTLDGSWELARTGNTLVQQRAGGQPRVLANLDWVVPSCQQRDSCQADESTIHYQTALGKKSRILITSSGNKVPITPAFGLIPYFRLQLFDLETGAEVFREEDLFRAREHSAMLSPDGDLLLVSDGEFASIHKLP